MIELAAALALLAAQDGPSFDCAAAMTPVENAICTDPDAARLDEQMATRYTAVRRSLWPAARRALQEDQRWFIGARDEWFENRDRWSDFPDIAARYSARIEALDRIDTRRADSLIGSWRTVAGLVEITDAGDGRVSVAMDAAQPVNARWLCGVQFTAQPAGSTVRSPADVDENIALSLSVREGVLHVEETRIGEGYTPGYCGANGSLAGDYLRVR